MAPRLGGLGFPHRSNAPFPKLREALGRNRVAARRPKPCATTGDGDRDGDGDEDERRETERSATRRGEETEKRLETSTKSSYSAARRPNEQLRIDRSLKKLKCDRPRKHQEMLKNVREAPEKA